jgi:hypothetical protein
VSIAETSMYSDFEMEKKIINPRVVNISPHLQSLKRESPKVQQP